MGAVRVALAGVAVTASIIALAIFAGADVVGRLFADEGLEPSTFATLLRIGVAYVPLFALMQVLRYCTQAYKTMVPSVMVGTIIQPVTRYLLGLAAVLAGLGVAGVIGGMVVGTVVGTVAAALYFRGMLSDAERVADRVADRKAMLRFALPQAGSSLLSVQDMGYGVIVLGLLRSNFEVGLFAAGLALQGPGALFLSGIVNIWAPVVSELHTKGEIARLEALFQTINRWTATFSFPVFAALILEGDLFARLFGNITDPRAAVIIAILAVGNLFYTGTGPTGYVLSMTGHPGVNFANSIAGVAAYVGLGFLIVPRYGAIGMAVVDAVVTAGLNVARVIEAKILVGVQPFGRTFFKPVLATLVAAGVLLTWRVIPGEPLWLQAVGVAVAAAVYVTVLRSLGMDPEERHVIERVRNRLRRRKEG